MSSGEGTSSSPNYTSRGSYLYIALPLRVILARSPAKLTLTTASTFMKVPAQNTDGTPTLMLANVLFQLGGAPRVWFETLEADINSWGTPSSSRSATFSATPLVASLLPKQGTGDSSTDVFRAVRNLHSGRIGSLPQG